MTLPGAAAACPLLLLLALLAVPPAPGFAQADELLPTAGPSVRPGLGSEALWAPTVPTPASRRAPLLIVDGQLLPDSVNIPPAADILGLRELEPAEAMRRYGEQGRHGALLIETGRRKRRLRL